MRLCISRQGECLNVDVLGNHVLVVRVITISPPSAPAE